ncbi:MAG: hypothetical protein HGB11_11950, partial [Chlorobiales bacterium]|nr:hypothetical protein [Chlorobiales bacterium]
MIAPRFFALLALISVLSVPLRAQTARSSNAADKYCLFNSGTGNVTSNSVGQLAFNSKSKQMWLGTRGGLSVSNDGGSSFRTVTDISRFNKNGVFGLAVKGDSILASTAYTSDKDGNPQAGDGMMFSIDAGNTWKSIPQPLDKPDETTEQYGINSLEALPIVVPEQNVIYDLALGPRPGMVWAATWSGGIRRSMDYGNTWERVVLPPAGKQTISPTDTLNFNVAPQRGSDGYLVYLGFSVFAASDAEPHVQPPVNDWPSISRSKAGSVFPYRCDREWVKPGPGQLIL